MDVTYYPMNNDIALSVGLPHSITHPTKEDESFTPSFFPVTSVEGPDELLMTISQQVQKMAKTGISRAYVFFFGRNLKDSISVRETADGKRYWITFISIAGFDPSPNFKPTGAFAPTEQYID